MFSVSTPALLEYKATLPSNKRGSIAAESRQQFLEVYQNKALILHDTIEALERCVGARKLDAMFFYSEAGSTRPKLMSLSSHFP